MAYSSKTNTVLDGMGNERIPALEETYERIWGLLRESSHKGVPPIDSQELRIHLFICLSCGVFIALCAYQACASE